MLKKITLGLLLLLSLNAAAEPLQIGQSLPLIELQNQHSKSIKIAADVKTILFAVEKSAADLVNNYLMKQEPEFLGNKKAYFIADISGMPSMITKMFAIPKMQNRPYDILLSRKDDDTRFIPRKKEFVSVITLSDGKVAGIEFIDKPEQLLNNFK